MSAQRLIVCAEPAAFVGTIAQVVGAALEAPLTATGTAVLALPGGTTPTLYLGTLATLPLPWERVQVTLTDERRVPPGDPSANENLIRQQFLIGRAAQARYIGWHVTTTTDSEAEDIVGRRLADLRWPLDLAVLGMGEDGHVAALFPYGADAAAGPVVATLAPGPPRARLSLTFATLAAARQVLVVVAGTAKHALLDEVFSGQHTALPIGRLHRVLGARLSAIALNT
jgi:6-phosphogluconolactonase